MEGFPNGLATTEYCASSQILYGLEKHHYNRLPSILGSYPQHPYPGVSSSMVPLSTAAGPPIDSALATAGPYGQGPLMPDGDPATRVVGSRGRGAILPSAPGRPAAPVAGSAEVKNQIKKNADGKFPCPHCTKTYIQAKYLERHLLIHTGNRPYMCVLCRDTFTRSDVLKRHFMKCSVRRGNPTEPCGCRGCVNDVQWMASPGCQGRDADLYPGWTAFDSDSVSGHSAPAPWGLCETDERDGTAASINSRSGMYRSGSLNTGPALEIRRVHDNG